MNVIIFLCNRSLLKCDIDHIKQPDTQYILIVNNAITRKLSSQQIAYFDEVISVPDVTEQHVSSVINQQQQAKHTVRCVTDDENCIYLCALINEKYKLNKPYQNDVTPFYNKEVMKQSLKDSGVNLPKYVLFDKQNFQQNSQTYLKQVLMQLNLPIFAKPIKQAASVGTQKIDTERDMTQFAEQALSSQFTYELDEYLHGKLFHIDSIVKNGEILISNVFEYSIPVYNFRKGIPLGTIMWLDNQKRVERLKEFNAAVLNHLATPDGATHLELFELSNGELVFLEVGARSAGGYVVPCFDQTFGFNYQQAHFEARLGLPIDTTIHIPKHYHSWAFLPMQSGTVTALHEPNIQSDYRIEWNVKVGDTVQTSADIYNTDSIAGVIFYQNKDYDVLYEDFKRLNEYKAVSVCR